jgi:hypothetical protein
MRELVAARYGARFAAEPRFYRNECPEGVMLPHFYVPSELTNMRGIYIVTV